MALYIGSILYLAWFPFIFVVLYAYYTLALVKCSREQAKRVSTDETGCSSSRASTSTFLETPSIAIISENDIDSELSGAGVYFANKYPPSKAPNCQYSSQADQKSTRNVI